MRLLLEPQPVQRGDSLWTWEASLVAPLGLVRFPLRMVVAGYPLPHGKLGLAVVSPLAPSPAVVEWLQQTGDVQFVVAPNKQHHWWAGAMKAAFPGCLLVAPASLALQQRGHLAVDIRVTPLAGPQDLPGSWPLKQLDLQPIQGMSWLDELALLHRPSSTLILTDTALNLQPAWLQQGLPGCGGAGPGPLLAPYLGLVGAGRRCCCPTRPLWRLTDDPGALKASLDVLLASWEFEQLSMAHGEFITTGGKQALLEGTVAFVNDIVRGKAAANAAAAAAGDGGGGGLTGTMAAAAVAAAVISTAVGIGLAGIVQARAQQ